MTERRSSFGLNLFLQFVLCVALSIAASGRFPAPLRMILDAVANFAIWSFSIGLVYGFFRLFGARVDFIEYYYDTVPLGLIHATVSERGDHDAFDTAAHALEIRAEHQPPAPAAVTSEFDWEDFFSANFVRYAGLLLIVSSLFAYLFKIEWDVLQKTIASFLGAGVALGLAEFSLRRGKAGLGGSSFVVGFALLQFALTLLASHLGRDVSAYELPDYAGRWLIVKGLLTVVASAGLLRYRAAFVPVVFFLIAYVAPLSLLRIAPSIELVEVFAFALMMCVLALAYGVYRRDWRIPVIDVLCVNPLVVLTYLAGASPHYHHYFSGVRPVISADNGQGLAALAVLATIFTLHLLAGALYSVKHKDCDRPALVTEMLLTQFCAAGAIITVQAGMQLLTGYYGITLLCLSLVSFGVYLLVRAKVGESRYTRTMLNTALIISAVGMFLQTKGTWTAVVFLSFSCAVLYVSFVLGTLRTRAYAFVVLGVSLIKLYFECYELFDSISGTTVILVIGMVLIGLSYKLETLKTRLRGAKSGG